MKAFPLTISCVLMAMGLAGCVIPGLPGTPLVYIAILLYGYMEGFAHITVGYLLLGAAVLAVVAYVEHLAHSWRGRKFVFSRPGAVGAGVLGLAGLIVLLPLGLVFGAVLGAVAGELAAGRAPGTAVRQGIGTVLSLVRPRLLSLVVSLLLVVSFILKIVR